MSSNNPNSGAECPDCGNMVGLNSIFKHAKTHVEIPKQKKYSWDTDADFGHAAVDHVTSCKNCGEELTKRGWLKDGKKEELGTSGGKQSSESGDGEGDEKSDADFPGDDNPAEE